jgi:hypothetical protein
MDNVEVPQRRSEEDGNTFQLNNMKFLRRTRTRDLYAVYWAMSSHDKNKAV